MICGHVHDGDAPPKVCPVCGAPFPAFQKECADPADALRGIEVAESRPAGTRYVIVGNSAAGRSAGEAIRALDPNGSVTIVTEEAVPIYARPLLPDFLGGMPRDRLLGSGWRFGSDGIEVLNGVRVETIDVAGRGLRTDGGEAISYDYLLLSTGSAPIRIPWPGSDTAGIAYFRTFADAEKIAGMIGGARRAVVVGGGLLGLEFVRAFLAAEMEVVHLVREDQVGFPVLDREGGALLHGALTELGVRVELEDEVEGFDSSGGRVSAVRTKKGSVFPCDVVGVAVGARPRTEPARAAGLEVNRGVLVDRGFRTSAPGVYAAGDVAEAYDRVWGEPRVNTSWRNALEQGRLAGAAMAGGKVEYEGSIAANYQLTAGLPFCSIGIGSYPPSEEFGAERRYDPEGRSYRKLVTRGGRLVGATLIGDLSEAAEIEEQVKGGQ